MLSNAHLSPIRNLLSYFSHDSLPDSRSPCPFSIIVRMKTFEFVVSNGAPERPSASVRSHAVKSGLQRKNKAAIPSGPKDAQLTIRQKNNLKGRFRLTDKASTAKTSAEPSKNEEPTEEPQAARVSTAQETKPDRSTATGCIVDYLSRQDNSALLKALVQDGETPSQSYLCGRWELTQSPSQGRGDPFNTLTVHQNSDVDRLMKFCKYSGLRQALAC